MVGENLLKEQCHKIVDLIKRLQRRFRKLFRFHEGDCGPIIIYGSCREAERLPAVDQCFTTFQNSYIGPCRNRLVKLAEIHLL